MTEVFPDWHYARFPTPAMAILHSEHRARHARFKRLALPGPSANVAVPALVRLIEAPKPAIPSAKRIIIVAEPLASQFEAAQKMIRAQVGPRTKEIIRIVARHHNLFPDDLTAPRRWAEYIAARMIAMYLCRIISGDSFPHIGRAFSKDHTTVLHAVQKIAAQVSANPDFAAEIGALFVACGGYEG